MVAVIDRLAGRACAHVVRVKGYFVAAGAIVPTVDEQDGLEDAGFDFAEGVRGPG